MSALTEWLSAFGFTQAVEVPIYLWAMRRMTLRFKPLIAFGASAITHPVVWFVIPGLFRSYVMMAVAAETFAVTIEALYFRAFFVPYAVWLSLGANAASVGLGLGSRAIFGWP
jgi:hypothetical protein